ncbi:MAG: carboxylating nicotinate-nucleotide diphosphorylase [Xanthomonadaceae bacterium]|nr:carboxylating nicotinate-nucleotide diphosphorylase [Xanthomonadaceae bacterium]
MHDSALIWKQALNDGLHEDGAAFDWTAFGAERKITGTLWAKADGIWAATPLIQCANQLARELGVQLSIEPKISGLKDGILVKKGQELLVWSGDAKACLTFERPFINLASYVSGIATQTNLLVQEISKSDLAKKPRLTATRKTLPGYRDLAIHGVFAGGGFSHRLGLSSGVLIKENHISAYGGIKAAIENAKQWAPHGLKIEIEVKDQKELELAYACGAEIVLLDNFTPDQVRKAIEWKSKQAPKLVFEVSGGINVSNIRSYCIAGVDVISSGSLTHSVTALDLSLVFP